MTATRLTPGPRDERGVLQARIADAARDEFAAHGYAGTTIRAIARVADVDPALVYHYFKTKQQLLEAVTQPPHKWLTSVAVAWATPRPQLGERLVRNMLEAWTDDEIRPVLRAILLTAAHEDSTRHKVRMIVEHSLIGSSTVGTDDDDRELRSGLIATQLIGLCMLRYIYEIEPIASMSPDAVVASIAPTIQRYIDGTLAD